MDTITINQLSLKLSNDEFENVVKRLCFFAPSGSGSYIRDLHDFITLQALSVMPSGQHSAHEIYSKIREIFGPRFEYEEIFDALRRLSLSEQIRSTAIRFEDHENKFDILMDKRNQLREMVKEEEKFESQVLADWKSFLQKKYPGIPPTILAQLVTDIKVCAYRLLSKHSVESLELYYGNDEKLSPILENMNSLEYLDTTNIIPKEFEPIRRQEVFDFFLQANEARKKYIASLMHSLFILYLTQVDSSCAAILRNDIKGGKIYLDTNFVFALVGLSGGDMLLASQRLVDFTHRLGYEIVISPRTKSEYEHALGSFLRETKSKPLPSPELATLALQATSDNDVYTNYWNQVVEAKGTYIDPQIYFDYYKNVEEILEHYGVCIDDTFHKEIMARDVEIAIEASRLKEVIGDSFGQQAMDTTSQHVLDHDAYHRLLILKYREGNPDVNFLDAKAWFLTLDSKLPKFDRVSRGKDKLSLPFCVLSGQWLQLIRPYIGGNGEFDITQAQMLVTPLLRAYPKPPTKLINSVITTLAMSSKFVPNAVTRMLSDRHFMEKFQSAETDEVRQDLIDSFYAAYAEETERELQDKNKQVEEMQSIIGDLTSKTQRLAEDLTYQNEEKAKVAKTLQEREKEFARLTSDFEHVRENDAKQNKDELQRIETNLNEKYDQLSAKFEKGNIVQMWVIVGLVWGVYLGFRQPWLNSSNPIIELITSALIAVSVGGFFNKKSRIYAVIILVATVLFGIWIFGDQKAIDTILYLSAIAGGIGGVYPLLDAIVKRRDASKIDSER